MGVAFRTGSSFGRLKTSFPVIAGDRTGPRPIECGRKPCAGFIPISRTSFASSKRWIRTACSGMHTFNVTFSEWKVHRSMSGCSNPRFLRGRLCLRQLSWHRFHIMPSYHLVHDRELSCCTSHTSAVCGVIGDAAKVNVGSHTGLQTQLFRDR
jgi:hypothetical protein